MTGLTVEEARQEADNMVREAKALERRASALHKSARALLHLAVVRHALDGVAAETGFKPKAVCGHRRTGDLVRARAMASAAMRESCGMTMTQIGLALGGRDHSTVRNLLHRAETLRRDNRRFAEGLDRIITGRTNRPPSTRRKCLRCGKPFDSDGAHDRICPRCEASPEWKSGTASDCAVRI